MNMSHNLLYKKVLAFITKKEYLGIPSKILIMLLHKTIFANVATNCRIKGSKREWTGLPKDKSLFNKPNGIGLPIGNFNLASIWQYLFKSIRPLYKKTHCKLSIMVGM